MSRNYCITINNWREKDIDNLKNLDYQYVIIGKEVGENGTPHLQIYLQLKNTMRFETLVKKLEKRSHIERPISSPDNNILYCKKDGNFIELGTPKNQGHRSDLDEIRNLAVDGGMRLVSTIGNIQQIKVAEKFLTYNERIRDFKPKVIWIYGSSGSGKSRMARKIVNDDTYTKNTNHKWFDGYDAHKNLILDDFRDSWMKITDLLSILDRYERQVECKGGNRQLLAENIIITSITHPKEMYIHAKDEPKIQLLRRIDFIIDRDLTISQLIEAYL